MFCIIFLYIENVDCVCLGLLHIRLWHGWRQLALPGSQASLSSKNFRHFESLSVKPTFLFTGCKYSYDRWWLVIFRQSWAFGPSIGSRSSSELLVTGLSCFGWSSQLALAAGCSTWAHKTHLCYSSSPFAAALLASTMGPKLVCRLLQHIDIHGNFLFGYLSDEKNSHSCPCTSISRQLIFKLAFHS